MKQYTLTIKELVRLCRDFQADCHDGFVSNDESYFERKLDNGFEVIGLTVHLDNGDGQYMTEEEYQKFKKSKNKNEGFEVTIGYHEDQETYVGMSSYSAMIAYRNKRNMTQQEFDYRNIPIKVSKI